MALIDRLIGLGFTLWRIDEATARLAPIDPPTLEFCNLLAARSLPPFCLPAHS